MRREDLLGSAFSCECGREHSVPTRRFVIGRGVLDRTPQVLREFGLVGSVFLVADPTTYEAAGESVDRALRESGFKVNRCILPDRPVAGDETHEYVRRKYVPGAVVVTCGSGTVTDLGKWTANENEIPLIAVATAPSMNGYASNIIAVMHNGVKVTWPVRPSLAVIADIDILSNAPIEMIRAGLGDALAKPVCNADWKLASIVKGEHFCGRAFELIRDLESIYVERAKDIGRRDPQAVAALSESLLYSGISMVLAGSSSPASGGEHLISHSLDMRARSQGREPDFHGAQVGVGTVITSRLYEMVLGLDPSRVQKILESGEVPSHDEVLKRVSNYFLKMSKNVEEHYKKKMLTGEARRAERKKLASSWARICDETKRFLMPSKKLKEILSSAGAKTSYADLGLGRDEFRETVYLARAIRPRYTILDVAWELGLLEEFIQEVI